MKQPIKANVPRAGKAGERTGTKCPLCDEAVLRQEISTNGAPRGTRLVCSKRGCPWQGREQ